MLTCDQRTIGQVDSMWEPPKRPGYYRGPWSFPVHRREVREVSLSMLQESDMAD